MNPIEKLKKRRRLFWSWRLHGRDLDAELNRAITIYQRRYQRRPLLLMCHPHNQPTPRAGLQVRPHPFIPRRRFYFAVHGGVSVRRSRRPEKTISSD